MSTLHSDRALAERHDLDDPTKVRLAIAARCDGLGDDTIAIRAEDLGAQIGMSAEAVTAALADLIARGVLILWQAPDGSDPGVYALISTPPNYEDSLIKRVLATSPYSATTFLIHIVFANLADSHPGRVVTASGETIAKMARTTRQTVSKSTTQMVKDGHLTILRSGAADGQPNTYQLVFPTEKADAAGRHLRYAMDHPSPGPHSQQNTHITLAHAAYEQGTDVVTFSVAKLTVGARATASQVNRALDVLIERGDIESLGHRVDDDTPVDYRLLTPTAD